MQTVRPRHPIQQSFSFVEKPSARSRACRRERLRELLSGELDFHGQNGSHIVHSWHPFPAKFPPQLPRLFIRELTEPGEIVLDPMMGSCTTLIEALLLQRRCIGTDIDPLTLEIGRAKLKPIDVGLAWTAGKKILAAAQNTYQRNSEYLRKELDRRFDEDTRDFIDYWFKKKTQLELISLVREIESTEERSLRDFFQLVFSGIIITKSGGVSLARDLAHTRPHKVERTPNSAFAEFWSRIQRVLRDNDPDLHGIEPQILEADARSLPLRDNSVDLIVTSPPYASHAIDYMRAHKFSLVWFGFPVRDLAELRRRYIGGDSTSDVDLTPLPQLSSKIVRSLSRLDVKKGIVLHRYYSEMMQIFEEMIRVLKSDHAAVVVVGSSKMRGIDVETGTCLGEIAEAVGFDLVHVGERRLDRDRRMMPTRWHTNSSNGIESRMQTEFVLGLFKPKRSR
jgi:DNA modification methylase